jgi:hypothetical protein
MSSVLDAKGADYAAEVSDLSVGIGARGKRSQGGPINAFSTQTGRCFCKAFRCIILAHLGALIFACFEQSPSGRPPRPRG